jgi:hypothetical protein
LRAARNSKGAGEGAVRRKLGGLFYGEGGPKAGGATGLASGARGVGGRVPAVGTTLGITSCVHGVQHLKWPFASRLFCGDPIL